MFRILGYPDRITARPGDTIRFMVSCREIDRYTADIVRLRRGDVKPDDPGIRETVVDSPIAGSYPGRFQPVQAGSYGVVSASDRLSAGGGLAVVVTVMPTLPGHGRQHIIGRWDAGRAAGWSLYLDEAGRPAMDIGDGAGRVASVVLEPALPPRIWARLAAVIDPQSRQLRLACAPVHAFPRAAPRAAGSITSGGIVPADAGIDLSLAAAWTGQPQVPRRCHQFSGRVEAPSLLRGPADEATVAGLLAAGTAPAEQRHRLLAAWDLGHDIPGDTLFDAGPHHLHGRLVNLPTRAVPSSAWDGTAHCWILQRDHYAAAHFHDDDLEDCGWEPDFAFTVPADLKSGAYAARLTATAADGTAEEERIVFFVCPPAGQATARIAFLASTMTYVAYSNMHETIDHPDMEVKSGVFTVLGQSELFLHEHREYGVSPYDTHPDGWGVTYSSRLRPLFSMHLKGPCWAFNADTQILDWLEADGFDYDVVTDEALHLEGPDVLAPYNVIITGTHPEYWTTAMWDAAVAYQNAGGRLMYLGGNGFYWRTATAPGRPHAIEIRRTESGARYWGSEPGEGYHSFTGEYGGLWRRLGRAPQTLVGIGTVATGFDFASHFRRQPGADDPRAAFIFDGVPEEIIGDFGTLGGGAAGEEIDRADPWLGTPAHALVLARSEGHSRYFNIVPEETLFHHPTINGEEARDCYADMVFYETPNGGAVFSTGSITWAGSLAHNGYDNSVARITANVLRRFAEDQPFPDPTRG